MTTIAEYEKLLVEPTEAQITAELRKDLAAGHYGRCTKRDFHECIQALARDIQSPGETPEQAYTRAIEMTDAGKALYKAYQAAPDAAPGRVEKYVYIGAIQERADARFPEIARPQRRFAHAINCDGLTLSTRRRRLRPAAILRPLPRPPMTRETL